ncbi:methyltransferase domain-containing protein [Streptomyces sp. UNOB3_S3]|uniref:methyltransferase domain-containing protein n=1 Tax=Streptomyces sp. UNOB3_S3 TaxID=2871682 RepID=UPI001E38F273|nr:methyltransferase domain-containing protein [Streptomyces sp. UNOB3_S3]
MLQCEERRARLAAVMDKSGARPADSSWIRDAFAARPRHLFAPDRLWYWDGHAYVPVDRKADPQRWAAEVYAGPDDPAITQITGGVPSSSLSCPAIIADMLDSVMLEPGHRVLELGAGQGYNAALLDWRTGPGLVTTVEVDPTLAAAAQDRSEVLGTGVAVQTGDGELGWPDGAPYDRVVSTYAVESVPWAWIEQTRPGGRIVTPWGRLGHVALTVADDGKSATGWMQGLAAFMPSRTTPEARRSWRQVRGDRPTEDERALALPPGRRNDGNVLFVLRVCLPDVEVFTRTGDDHRVTGFLHDGHSSWATLTACGGGTTLVRQGGPRRLADEAERVLDGWAQQGEPSLYDFGMTVLPDTQFTWCKDPGTGPYGLPHHDPTLSGNRAS